MHATVWWHRVCYNAQEKKHCRCPKCNDRRDRLEAKGFALEKKGDAVGYTGSIGSDEVVKS